MPKNDIIIRQNWGKTYHNLPQLDLLAIQRTSYEYFLKEAIGETLKEISPVDDFTEKNWSLSLDSYRLGKCSNTPTEAINKGITFDAPLYVEATLTNKKTNKSQKQEIFLGDIPQMTDRGTFIVNGIERAVVNQLVRSPGVFFTATLDPVTGKQLFNAEIRPAHGSWLEFSTTRHGTITVKIDRRRKFPVTSFLRALGLSSNTDIKDRFAEVEDKEDYLGTTLTKDETSSETEALIEIFKKMHPGEPVVLDAMI
jgi:DNA-directed RNA polymerase subunit beta